MAEGKQKVGDTANNNHHDKQTDQTQSNTDNISNNSVNKPQRVELERSLGLYNGVSVILGVIIGSGIFVSPKGVLLQAGSVGAALTVWSLCGLLALLGALCFAELGTSIGQSGGEYTYIGLAYGPLASFLYLWVTTLVIMPCANAISALTFANYVLQPFYSGCAPPESALRLWAVAILLLLVYVNCASVRASLKLQNAFTAAKVLALALIIGYGLLQAAVGGSGALQSGSLWAGTQTSLPQLAQAFYAGFYTYSGWNSLNCVTEEIRSPVKNMPRAIVLSISAITLIYILTNFAYFATLTRDEILSSDAIGVLFGERALPFARWLMPLAVACSTVGGLNGSIFASSRILFAGARQGQLCSALQMINLQCLTPIPALLLLAITSIAYLFTTEILVLINYTTFVEASLSALAVSTLLTLRIKLPDLERPLRVPLLVPLTYLTFSVLLIALPIWSAPKDAAIGLVLLLAGLPVYYLTARWRVKPPGYQLTIDRFNELTQKLTVSVAPSANTPII